MKNNTKNKSVIKEITVKRGDKYRQFSFILNNDSKNADSNYSLTFNSLKDGDIKSHDSGIEIAILALEFNRWHGGKVAANAIESFKCIEQYKKASTIAYGLLNQLENESVEQIKIKIDKNTIQFECDNTISCTV